MAPNKQTPTVKFLEADQLGSLDGNFYGWAPTALYWGTSVDVYDA